MGKKLYVGGLPAEFTEVQLNEMFAACGAVASAEIMKEKRTGQSRGFGFVEMSTEQEAQDAIKKLHDSAVGGNRLVVNEAKPIAQTPLRGFRGFDGGAYGGRGYGSPKGGGHPNASNRGGFGGGFKPKGHDRRGGGGGGKGES